MTNSNIIDKKRFFIIFFFHCIKMDNTTYYQRSREIMLHRAKDYNENDKERLREQARNKYRNSEQDKEKKRKYGKKSISKYVRQKEVKIKRIYIKKDIEKQKSLEIINKKVYLLLNSYI